MAAGKGVNEVVTRLHRRVSPLAPIHGVSLAGISFKDEATSAQRAAAQAAFDAESKTPKRTKPETVNRAWVEGLPGAVGGMVRDKLLNELVMELLRDQPWLPRERGLGWDAEEDDV